jgi:hypothetical protein
MECITKVTFQYLESTSKRRKIEDVEDMITPSTARAECKIFCIIISYACTEPPIYVDLLQQLLGKRGSHTY